MPAHNVLGGSSQKQAFEWQSCICGIPLKLQADSLEWGGTLKREVGGHLSCFQFRSFAASQAGAKISWTSWTAERFSDGHHHQPIGRFGEWNAIQLRAHRRAQLEVVGLSGFPALRRQSADLLFGDLVLRFSCFDFLPECNCIVHRVL